MKVWGIAWHDRKRVIVAAKSQREAADLIGCSLHHLRGYAAETGNAIELGVALNKPKTVFWRDDNDWNAPYVERPKSKAY